MQYQGHLQDPGPRTELHLRGRTEEQVERDKATSDKRDPMREIRKKEKLPHTEVEQPGGET